MLYGLFICLCICGVVELLLHIIKPCVYAVVVGRAAAVALAIVGDFGHPPIKVVACHSDTAHAVPSGMIVVGAAPVASAVVIFHVDAAAALIVFYASHSFVVLVMSLR